MKIRGFVIALVTCVLAGCGGGGDNLAPVSGVIKLNGEPLEGATVTFRPLDTTAKNAPTSFGKTDAEGRYTLETASGKKGAFIGKNRVTIVKEKGGDDSDDSIIEFVSEIPPEYNKDSKLEVEVTKDGTDEADFDVKAPKGWQKRRRKRRRDDDDDDDDS